MSDIKELYEMLYQEDSMVTQIDMARQTKDLSVFIMPPRLRSFGKSVPTFCWRRRIGSWNPIWRVWWNGCKT